MQLNLLLVDLDGTLIDKNYRTTDNAIQEELDKIQKNGFEIVLCSDSAIEYLEGWQRRLGISPLSPIIGEKGGIIAMPNGASIIPTAIDASLETAFCQARESLIKALSTNKGQLLILGDVNELAMRPPEFNLEYQLSRVILVNTFRRVSFSMYIRKVDERGHLKIDSALTKKTWQEIEPTLLKHLPGKELTLDVNHSYGIIIIHHKQTSKTRAVKRLLEKRRYKRVFMVGDSKSDYIQDPQVIHLAVGNATAEYKQLADYVATQKLTSGVIELLNYCLNLANP